MNVLAEPPNDPRDPFAVEVRARDDDDAAVAPEERGGQDASVPEGEDRLAARRDDRVVMLEPVDPPAVGRAERVDDRCGRRRDQRRLAQLARGQSCLDAVQITRFAAPPGRGRYMPS